MFLSFEEMSRPIFLSGCEELEPLILSVLRGWNVREVVDSGAMNPVIEIKKTEQGYARLSPWLSQAAVFQDKVNATCDFLVDLIKLYISSDCPKLCFHCAAVSFGEGLLVFPSSYEAGKSTLSIHLAALGALVYADDVLPIVDNENKGIAPGILPRLRLPLPSDSQAAFRDFVARRQGLRNNRFQYVELKEDELAPLGTTAPITKIITLHRDSKAKAELIGVKTSDMLKDSIMQNFSSEIPAFEILDRLHGIVDNAECYSLRYPCGEEGARLLREAFK